MAATAAGRATVAGAVAWNVLGDTRLTVGDPSATEAYARVVALGQELGVSWLTAEGRLGLGLVRAHTGDHAGARAVDCHLAVWASEGGAAAVRAHHGDPRPTLQQLGEALRGQGRPGTRAIQETVLRQLGVVLARIGQDRPAAVLLGACVTGALYEGERRRVRVALDAVTERLGQSTADRLRGQGAAMSQEELVELALGAVDAVVP